MSETELAHIVQAVLSAILIIALASLIDKCTSTWKDVYTPYHDSIWSSVVEETREISD